jgi:tetratricopeptide (TPR) repeat protein
MSTELADQVTRRSSQWQVPVFLVGIAALAFVGFGRSLWHISDYQRLDGELSAARDALKESPPDLKKALELTEFALNRAQQFPERLGEAHYLAGSAYCRLAVQSSPKEAEPIWQKARFHLEEAAKGTVPKNDDARFHYDLGKARFHTGAPAQEVIDCLADIVDSVADDRAEGYRMLTESYVRLSNLQAALDANKKQLDLPQIDERLLAPARLRRGQLFLQLHQPAEARKVLARIDKTTPAIYAEARWLRAKSCQEDKLYEEAARLWEEILNDTARSHPGPADHAHCSLGECYYRLDRQADAVSNWEKAVREGGEGAQAATMRLAETKLAKRDLAEAETGFQKALDGVKVPTDYHNSLLDLREAQRLIEQACKTFRLQGDYERSLKMADLYRKLAPPEAAQGLIGDAADEWAKHLDQDPKTKANAVKVYREAGVAYEKAAGLARSPADQAKWLWLSADRYRKAQDSDQAVALLRAFLRVETSTDRRGEGWLALGTVYQELHQDEDARAAFFKCIECPGIFALRARYRLAKMHIDEGKLDEAELELKQNLELLVRTHDLEAHEITLFMLADLYYRRDNFRFAALRYQEALDQYPNNPATITVRWRLAECYRKLAQQESNRQNPYQSVDRFRLWMQMAKANYEKLVDDLTGLEARGLLKVDGQKILHKAEFMVADCCFDLEQFEEAARIYDILADRDRYRIDGLTALKQSFRCYLAIHQPEKARESLNRLRETLRQLNDNLFKGQPDEMDRKAWLKWVEWAEKQH